MEFSRSDFDTLNKLAPSGRVNESVDVDIYWFHAIARSDAAFFQSRQMHRHRFFELHFILGGMITYATGEGSVTVGSGEYVIFAPDVGHKIESYSASLIKCSAAFTVGREEALYGALVYKCGTAFRISEDALVGLRFIAELTEAPYYGTLVKNKLFEIIYGISGDGIQKRQGEHQERLIGGIDARIFKAKQFIKDNPHVFLGCDDMAEYCNLSAKQLNRLFIKHEGVSLLGYLHASKLEQAKALLTAGDASLREVSEDLGFSSVYYFCRFFQRLENMTPGEYRRVFRSKTEL